jgi:hypothetical protein
LAVSFAYWSLLLSLTVVNLLVFYFDQFSAIITAVVQFSLLLAVVYYRKKYLEETGEPAPRTEDQPSRM